MSDKRVLVTQTNFPTCDKENDPMTSNRKKSGRGRKFSNFDEVSYSSSELQHTPQVSLGSL